jgi:uncharacterized membrane protein YeaQ/YmgE (transglycosylase-associated protein family)
LLFAVMVPGYVGLTVAVFYWTAFVAGNYTLAGVWVVVSFIGIRIVLALLGSRIKKWTTKS